MYIEENGKSYLKVAVPNRNAAKNYRKSLSLRWKYFVGKRAFDLFFSSLVLVFLLSWLLPIIALLIKITSKGPVFFVQKRVGYLGRSFNCYKFRTMRVNALADKKAAKSDDVRITKLGQFLRKSNIDELPQFFNVFIGNMSIVGPRPHMYADCRKFSNLLDNYKFRNLVKPGITGLAQVKGFRGPAETYELIFHRYQFDAFYVRNANFWLDIRIIRKTAAQTIFFLLGKLIRKNNLQQELTDIKVYRKISFTIKQMMN